MKLSNISVSDPETEYIQDSDDYVDVSGYSEAALVAKFLELSAGSGTVTVQTSIENDDVSWVTIGTMSSVASSDSFPATRYLCLSGPSASGHAPGFARYLRIKIDFDATGRAATVGVKALLKP